MFIRAVDDGLERLLRARLPLPEDAGDISFDPPNSTWSAQLSRLTINLFLYDLDRSTQPTHSVTQRLDANGRPERRAPQPMVTLSYLLSAWTGNPRDEHQLLGDAVSIIAGVETLDDKYLALPVTSSVHVSFGSDETNRVRDIWSGVGGQLRAAAILQVTVATDTHDWADEAPAVQRILVLTSPGVQR